MAARHPRGFFRIQDGRQDGRNSEPKPTNDNNFHSKRSRMVMLVLRNMFQGQGMFCVYLPAALRAAQSAGI